MHFGIREHAMGSILGGIALQSLTRPYGGTFLCFSDYMRPAVRIAALMGIDPIYVWTHDSIGLGEDGPTHQPVEHLAALRAIPGLDVVRPADANETAVAWRTILEQHRPAGRPDPDPAEPADRGPHRRQARLGRGRRPRRLRPGRGRGRHAGRDHRQHRLRGADRRSTRGSCCRTSGVHARVVSMPCREWFEPQDQAYRDEVCPPSVRARVSIEAAVGQGWRDIVGDAGRIVSLEHYGASADAATLYREFGLTAEAVAQAARDSIAPASNGSNS